MGSASRRPRVAGYLGSLGLTVPNNAFARTVKRVIWFLPARRFRKQTARSIAELEDLIPTIESQWNRAKSLVLTKYSTLYNSMSFLLLLHYDFAVLAYNHATEVDELKQNLYARQLCLLLHEALDDIPAVFGAEFRKAALSLPSAQGHISAISPVLKTLNVIRKAHHPQISEIRNFVAAHRDHDALKQLEIMRRIKSPWLVSISAEFVEFLGNMARVLTPILTEMGNHRVILSHVAGRDSPTFARFGRAGYRSSLPSRRGYAWRQRTADAAGATRSEPHVAAPDPLHTRFFAPHPSWCLPPLSRRAIVASCCRATLPRLRQPCGLTTRSSGTPRLRRVAP